MCVCECVCVCVCVFSCFLIGNCAIVALRNACCSGTSNLVSTSGSGARVRIAGCFACVCTSALVRHVSFWPVCRRRQPGSRGQRTWSGTGRPTLMALIHRSRCERICRHESGRGRMHSTATAAGAPRVAVVIRFHWEQSGTVLSANSPEQSGTVLEQCWNSPEQSGTVWEQCANSPEQFRNSLGTVLEQFRTVWEQSGNNLGQSISLGTVWDSRSVCEQSGTVGEQSGTARNCLGTAWNSLRTVRNSLRTVWNSLGTVWEQCWNSPEQSGTVWEQCANRNSLGTVWEQC